MSRSHSTLLLRRAAAAGSRRFCSRTIRADRRHPPATPLVPYPGTCACSGRHAARLRCNGHGTGQFGRVTEYECTRSTITRGNRLVQTICRGPPVGMTWQRSQIPYCPCRACRFRRSPSPPPPSTICRIDLEPDQARRVLGRRGGLSRRVRAAESAICSCIWAGSGPNAAASTLHSGGSREDVARYLHPTTWGAAPVRRVTAWARTSV